MSITPEQCRPGTVVWYEPRPGVRFRGHVVGEPRRLGGEWVVSLGAMSTAYERFVGDPAKNYVVAAALFALHLDATMGDAVATQHPVTENTTDAHRNPRK